VSMVSREREGMTKNSKSRGVLGALGKQTRVRTIGMPPLCFPLDADADDYDNMRGSMRVFQCRTQCYE
jgi:hypothetical protein